MNYDRQIIISTGNSRRDLIWKQTTLSVSELYTQLSTPVRGTETLQEYSHMKKAQQDDLKDVGGFVGGSLNGQRRKANNMIGRDIITLQRTQDGKIKSTITPLGAYQIELPQKIATFEKSA